MDDNKKVGKKYHSGLRLVVIIGSLWFTIPYWKVVKLEQIKSLRGI